MYWNKRLKEYEAELRMLEIEKQIDYLTESDKHNVWLFDQMTSKIKELEENQRLLYEFLGVHKEVVNDTFLVEDNDKKVKKDKKK